MENFLLEGEQLLNQSSNNIVILTTHRIRFNDANSSRAHIISIMLEKISSCEIRYQSSPALLVIGVLVMAFGGLSALQMGGAQIAGPAMVLGLVFVIVYFTTRKHVISISSDGGTRISFETKGLKREAVIAFVNGIEKAKNQRVVSLCQSAYPVLA